MLKKTMTYTDYDGIERTEDHYFNLTKEECIKMQMSTDGGLNKLLEKIVNEKDAKKLYENFTMFIDKSYGAKSPDGRRFMKSQEILDNFKQTEAYSNLIVELMSDAKVAAEFFNAIIPQPQDAQNSAAVAPKA